MIPDTRERGLELAAAGGPRWLRPLALGALEPELERIPFYLSLEDDPPLQAAVLAALRRLGAPAIPALLKSRTPRALALLGDWLEAEPALLETRGEDFEAALWSLIEAENPAVRNEAVRVLARFTRAHPRSMSREEAERLLRLIPDQAFPYRHDSYACLGHAAPGFSRDEARGILDRLQDYESRGLLPSLYPGPALAALAARIGSEALAAQLERRLRQIESGTSPIKAEAYRELAAIARHGGYPAVYQSRVRRVIEAGLRSDSAWRRRGAIAAAASLSEARERAALLPAFAACLERAAGARERDQIVEVLLVLGPYPAERLSRWPGRGRLSPAERVLIGERGLALKEARGPGALALFLLDEDQEPDLLRALCGPERGPELRRLVRYCWILGERRPGLRVLLERGMREAEPAKAAWMAGLCQRRPGA